MLLSTLLPSLLLILAVQGEGTANINIPGFFEAKSPGKGYLWTKQKEFEQNGVKTQMYLASNEDSDNLILLIAQQPLSNKPINKKRYIDGNWDGTMEVMKNKGFAVQGEKPKFDEPIPNQVNFTFNFKNQQGTRYEKHIILFKKGIYTFQIVGGSLDEINKLSKVAETLIEK